MSKNLLTINEIIKLIASESSIKENKKELEGVSGVFLSSENTCPFKQLEKYLPDYLDNKIFVLTGLPSVGKTTFVYEWAKYFSLQSTKEETFCSVLFSLEMSTMDLIIRNNGTGGNFYIVENSFDFSLNEIKEIVKELSEKYDHVMVAIDYLHLIPDFMNADKEATRISKIISSLKLIAKELSCFMVVISDIGKSASYQTAKEKPLKMDIVKDSFSIAYNADMIFHLGEVDDLDVNLGLKILKNRYGFSNIYIPFYRGITIQERLYIEEKNIHKNRKINYSF